jgi:hypothetical protein
MARAANTCAECGGLCSSRSQRCGRCYRQGIALRFGSVADRFWLRVNRNGPVPPHRAEIGPCWVWMGSSTRNGYGQISSLGRKIATHRLSWELAYGQIPSGLQALHRCDNKRCVRPDHLFLGTALDNRHDCIAKNRDNHGERHGNAKLTWATVREMRTRYLRGQTTVEISWRFSADRKQVWEIVTGRRWVEPADRTLLRASGN